MSPVRFVRVMKTASPKGEGGGGGGVGCYGWMHLAPSPILQEPLGYPFRSYENGDADFFATRVIRTLDCHCVMLVTIPWLWILGLLSMLGKLVHLFVFQGCLPCFPYILFCFIMDKLLL